MPRHLDNLRIRYPSYFRFLNAIMVLSITLVIIAGFGAGARFIIITFRSAIILCVLYVGGSIVIKAWAAWEEMKQGSKRI